MHVRRLQKSIAVLALAMIVGGAAMITAGTAWGLPAEGIVSPDTSQPVLRFESMLHVVALITPTPPCPRHHPHCRWMLYLNKVRVPGNHQWVVGTSGRLTLPYPTE